MKLAQIIKSTGLFILLSTWLAVAGATPLQIVAAENFYGELASEIGGKQVQVTSIISNPDADPHLFATSPSVSRALNQANIIIYNGADYDSWINQMLATIDKQQVIVINVADLMGVKAGQNPHLWYKPETFPALARLLTAKINQLKPAAQTETSANLASFLHANQVVQQQVKKFKAEHSGIEVTATEPVFGYMAEALGLKMLGLDFQWKIMNDSEPSPKMIADYQRLLTTKQAQVLFYNNQVSDSVTKNMQQIARKNGIPVVGVSETLPAKLNLNQWLSGEISRTNQALAVSK